MGATEFGHYDGGMVGCVARRPINPGAFEGRGEGWAGELHRDLDLEPQTGDRRGAVLSMHDSLTTPPRTVRLTCWGLAASWAYSKSMTSWDSDQSWELRGMPASLFRQQVYSCPFPRSRRWPWSSHQGRR
jgi:hypothetical protein